MPSHSRCTRALVVLALIAACQSDQNQSALLNPSLATTTTVPPVLVSGAITGPDGTSICNQLFPGAVFTVRTVPIAPSPIIGPSQAVFCPADTYAFLVDSGDYRIRVSLPFTTALPWRWLEPGVVMADGSTPITKNVQVQPGLALGGGVTLDGVPLGGFSLTLAYGINPGFAAASGTSTATGGWQDILGRPFIPVQTNEQYAPLFTCNALGTVPILIAPTQPFFFPTEASGVDCQFQTSPATQYTNTSARVVATAFPGDIGGQSGVFLGTLGSGWGVQFPVAGQPVHIPFNATQLFRGGLIIASDPAHILTGFDGIGYLVCTACQDLGLDGSVRIEQHGVNGNMVEWRYSDAFSPEALGLSVVQRSFDNPAGGDYILYRYAITNTSAQTLRFFAGFFGDWDIDRNNVDDMGGTDFDGRLLYTTNGSGVGTHAGTLVAGARLAGRFFFTGLALPTALEQSLAMKGDLQVPSLPCCSDIRYLQSMGPIVLQSGATTVLWIALVLGDDKAQLLTNAAAAGLAIQARKATAAIVSTAPATTFSRSQLEGRRIPPPRKIGLNDSYD